MPAYRAFGSAMKAMNVTAEAQSIAEGDADGVSATSPCKSSPSVWPRPLTGFFPLLPALLSSSCCLLQLALNTFSIGCAGFARLTPYKPYLWALTAVSVAAMLQRHGVTRRTVAVTLLALLVAGSEEALSVHNAGSFRLEQSHWVGLPVPAWLRHPQLSPNGGGSSNSSPVNSLHHTVPQAVQPESGVSAPVAGSGDATAIFTLRGGTCEACIASLRQGLFAAFPDNIVDVTVHRSVKVIEIRLRDAAAVSDDALAQTMMDLKHPAFFIRRDHKH